MSKKRPVNLYLMSIRFPITAIASILHRISGVFLFLAIPTMLWALQSSLESADGFAQVQDCISSPIDKLLLLAIIAGLIYHLVAGVRHLLMDMFELGESKCGGKLGASLVFIISAALIVIEGWVLW